MERGQKCLSSLNISFEPECQGLVCKHIYQASAPASLQHALHHQFAPRFHSWTPELLFEGSPFL